MAKKGRRCAKCGAEEFEIATLRIYEEETHLYRDFCFACGMKALEERILQLGQSDTVIGWHFVIPDLRGKQGAAINYLPEVVELRRPK